MNKAIISQYNKLSDSGRNENQTDDNALSIISAVVKGKDYSSLIITLLMTFFIAISFSARSQDIEIIGGKYYKKGMLYSGLHIEYYKNKKTKAMMNIANGVYDGLVTLFYEDGSKQELRSYKDGNKDGVWITWDQNGNKTAQAGYMDNVKNGDWFIWSASGKLLYELHYKMGEKSGTWKIYDETGKLVDERTYN